jgi:hypothetical protein
MTYIGSVAVLTVAGSRVIFARLECISLMNPRLFDIKLWNKHMIMVSTYSFQPSLELNHFFVAEALLRVSISALRSLGVRLSRIGVLGLLIETYEIE